MKDIRFVRAACGALLLFLIAACSHSVPLALSYTPTADSPAVPEKVGVYFSEEFQTFAHKHSFGGDTWVFPLGAASTPLFGPRSRWSRTCRSCCARCGGRSRTTASATGPATGLSPKACFTSCSASAANVALPFV